MAEGIRRGAGRPAGFLRPPRFDGRGRRGRAKARRRARRRGRGACFDLRAASRLRPYARHDRGRGRRRTAANCVRRPERARGPEGGRRLRGLRVAGRREDKEEQAARRRIGGHDLLGARAGAGHRPRRHHGAAGRRACGRGLCRVARRGRHGARFGDYPEPPRPAVHARVCPRGGRHLPRTVELRAALRGARSCRRRERGRPRGRRGGRCRAVPALHGARHTRGEGGS